jgi:hypothetical protein
MYALSFECEDNRINLAMPSRPMLKTTRDTSTSTRVNPRAFMEDM